MKELHLRQEPLPRVLTLPGSDGLCGLGALQGAANSRKSSECEAPLPVMGVWVSHRRAKRRAPIESDVGLQLEAAGHWVVRVPLSRALLHGLFNRGCICLATDHFPFGFRVQQCVSQVPWGGTHRWVSQRTPPRKCRAIHPKSATTESPRSCATSSGSGYEALCLCAPWVCIPSLCTGSPELFFASLRCELLPALTRRCQLSGLVR